jgi:hypothetical protein
VEHTGAGGGKHGELAGQGVDQQMLRLARGMRARSAFAGFDQDDVEQQLPAAGDGGDAFKHAEPARAHADDGDTVAFHLRSPSLS